MTTSAISLEHIEEAIAAYDRHKIDTYYPDTGPFRREVYPKHLDFFAAGRLHRERLAIAGNRTGKTTLAAYEVALLRCQRRTPVRYPTPSPRLQLIWSMAIRCRVRRKIKNRRRLFQAVTPILAVNTTGKTGVIRA